MRAPLAGPLVVTQLFGSRRGGPGEAYTAEHVVAGQVIVVHCLGHAGLDIATPAGTPVLCMKGGVLRWPDASEGYRTALGLYAVVRLPNGEEHWYAHLSRPADVAGAIAAGQLLGYSGSSGNSTAPHLHVAKRPAHPDYANGFDGFVDFLTDFDHNVYPLLDLSLV